MKSSLAKLPIIFLVFLLMFFQVLEAQKTSAFDQLISVNQEWKNQVDVNPNLKRMPTAEYSEQELIKFHLQETEKLLR